MFSWAFKSNKELGESEIPNLFPLSLDQAKFVKSDILNTYLKILTDTMYRTHGLSDDQQKALWDNCVQSETDKGLITLVAEAMTDKTELYLVYSPSTFTVRKADDTEKKAIQDGYKKKAERVKLKGGNIGVYVSFKNYRRTEMLEIYSAFEHCILSSLNKSLNLSKAIQIKIDMLRQSVSLADAGIAREQAKSIAAALKAGNDTFMDAKDIVETAKVDISPAEKAILFLDGKRAFYLGLPLSYLGGEQTSGIGATGEADMRAVERGLQQYFVSILYPVLEAVFDVETEYRSEDFRILGTALEALKAFDVTSNEYLSAQTKREQAALLFNRDPKEEQERLDEEEADREEQAKTDAEAAAAALANVNKNPNQNPNTNQNVKDGGEE
jgi:hypothetical protein